MIREELFIRELVKRFNPRNQRGRLGDDAALLPGLYRGRQTLITLDTLCEGRHFKRGTAPERLGWKLAAVSLSDLAAMAAVPRQLLFSMALTRNTTTAWVKGLLKGISAAVRPFGVQVAGGDTVGADRLTLTSVAVGTVGPEGAVYRSGARPGDLVCVTGAFGWSLATRHHLCFHPRVREGRWLARYLRPSAMTDASDGLARSVELLTLEQGLGAEIDLEGVPLRKVGPLSLQRAARGLFDGEDFELVFTARNVPPKDIRRFEKKFALPLRVIGRVVKPKRIKYRLAGKTVTPAGKAYAHFS